MTGPETASTVADSNNKRWDEFVGWAQRYFEAEDFESSERTYKLHIMERVNEAREALHAGSPEWIDRLKRAFGPPNNLTRWQVHSRFLDWCREDPEPAAAALRSIWDTSQPLERRFDDFIAMVPANVARVSINEASFLHMVLDPQRYPVFRASPVAEAMKLTGYPNPHASGRTPAGARYEHYLGFLDRLIAEAAGRGLTLRDRLDAQSVMWSVTSWDPKAEWPEHDRAALLDYRASNIRTMGSPSSQQPVAAGSGVVPDVSRDQLLAAMAAFDNDERQAPPWHGWENDTRHKWAIVESARRYPVKHVIATATGIPTSAFSGGEQANAYVTKRGFTVAALNPVDSPNVWWVNQGGSYAQEREGGYLWAPKVSKSGAAFGHWTNLTKLRQGDLVLHYANSALHALSIVQAPAIDAERPSELPQEQWETDVYLVRTHYHDFPKPIALADIPVNWRESGPGPFTVHGGVKQGYLFPVPAGFLPRVVARFPDRWPGEMPILAAVPVDEQVGYTAPDYVEIVRRIAEQGLRIEERTLRRYHLSLATRGFVILTGVSGTGKTWLAEAYAESIGARHAVVAVAPNWTTNEDLLGYHNPITNHYHDTPFSRFLRDSAAAYAAAVAEDRLPQPYHLVLDEMNLARVEYYFASLLSAMEVRARHAVATLDLGPGDAVTLPPNLVVIGTVNIDETTHGFADKVYDRAQLVELNLRREDLDAHLAGRPYQDDLLVIWDAVKAVGPFAFRVLDEIHAYVEAAESMGVSWDEVLDEQIVQKILPKLKGTNAGIGESLEQLMLCTAGHYPLSHKRARQMLEGFHHYGFASYFS